MDDAEAIAELSPHDEEEWLRLRRQIQLEQGFWLGFVFALSSHEAKVFRQRVTLELSARDQNIEIYAPDTPEALTAALPWLLSPERRQAHFVWIESMSADAYGSSETPWALAWDWLFLRMNERREALRRHLPGALVIVAPPTVKPRLRDAAPDLWSIRSIVAELEGGTAGFPSAPLPFQSVVEEDSQQEAPDPIFWKQEADRRAPGSVGRAMALVEAARGYGETKQFSDAETLLREAIHIFHQHQQTGDGEQRVWVFSMLSTAYALLGGVQVAAEAWELASLSVHKSIEVLRDLMKSEGLPAVFLPPLADGLLLQGIIERRLEHGEEALASMQEALGIFRNLAKAQPEEYLKRLADCLQHIGALHYMGDRMPMALSAFQEAVDILRTLAKQKPARFGFGLAHSLRNLALMQMASGRMDDALALLEEAMELLWPLFAERPQALLQTMKEYLDVLLTCLEAIGREPSATLQERIDQVQAELETEA